MFDMKFHQFGYDSHVTQPKAQHAYLENIIISM